MSALSTKARKREIAEIEAWERTAEGQLLIELQDDRQRKQNDKRRKKKVANGIEAHQSNSRQRPKVTKREGLL